MGTAESDWRGQDRMGLEWTGKAVMVKDRKGVDRMGLEWNGADGSVLDRSGRKGNRTRLLSNGLTLGHGCPFIQKQSTPDYEHALSQTPQTTS